MPDDGDPEEFSEFLVYISDPLPQVGGCNNSSNDYLYRCLFLIYGTKSRLPQNIKTPELLKEKLGLRRDEPVPISCISHLEELAGTVKINVVGDYTYHSKRNCKRVANLILCNGHYSIAKNPNRKYIKAWYSEPKLPLVYEKNGVNNTVQFYDGTTHWNGTVQELNKLKSNRWSGKWCFIEKEKNYTFKQTFDRFNEERDALLDKSKKIGLPIDLRLCCGSHKIAALWLFEKLSRGIIANEPLDHIEAQWISDAMRGGLI